MYCRAIAYAVLASLYILQNIAYIFSGPLEFFATLESLHEPLTSSCNHNSNISLPFPYFQRLASFIHHDILFLSLALFFIFLSV
jgi:hypothetical protein